MKRRLIILAFAAVTTLGLGGCDKAKEAADKAKEAAGGAEAVTDLTSTFGSLTGTLEGIKDEASATAALPKLEAAGESLKGLTSKLDSLPDPVKETIKSKVGEFTGSLDGLIEKLKAIPGVGGIIEGPLETIKGHLTSLAG